MLGTNDLIEEAARILVHPVDLTGIDPDDEQAVDEATFAQMRARLDAWLADRSDRLLLLRYVREAALARADAYRAEMERWARRMVRQRRLADYCSELGLNVLRAERQLCGYGDEAGYRVELPNGVRVGIRSSSSVAVDDLDTLPPELVRVKTEMSPDKVEIGKRLKSGQSVPGARLVKSESMDWGRG